MEGHLVQYHPAISTGALPYVLAASSRPVTEILASACPLCDEWEHHLKKQPSCPEAPSGIELTVPARVFEQHLSHHLVQLALFSVPLTSEATVDYKSTEPEKNFGTLEVCTSMVGSALHSRANVSMLGMAKRCRSNVGSF